MYNTIDGSCRKEPAGKRKHHNTHPIMQITKITCLERNPPVQLELCFETASAYTPPVPASQPPVPTEICGTRDDLGSDGELEPNKVVVPRGSFQIENENGNRFKPRVFSNNQKNAIRQRGVVSSHMVKNRRTVFSLPPIRFYEARPPPFCSCAV